MKQIPLTKGQFALVDDDDYERLNKHKWYAAKSKSTYYAHRRIGKRGRMIYMHRDIMGLNDEPKLFADHRDHSGLNNQKYNLRVATRSQNNANRVSIGASKYLGVFRSESKKNPWCSYILKNGVRKYLGVFPTEREAAIAYNNAALPLHGEFANLNDVTNLHGQ